LNREERIKDAVEEITGIRPKTGEPGSQSEIEESTYIRRILMVSPAYDFFLVEEEGRLNRLFKEVYVQGHYDHVPSISHVESGKECLETLEGSAYDLVIIFKEPADMGVSELAQGIKEVSSDVLVVAVGNDVNGLIHERSMDHVFTWNGDGRIFLSIVQFIEDDTQILNNPSVREESRMILLVEDSVQHYSSYIHMIYEDIRHFISSVIDDGLTRDQVHRRMLRRPRVVLTTDFSEAEDVIKKYVENIICVISDLSGDDDHLAGIRFSMDLKEKKDVPIMVQSSASLEETPEEIEFHMKSSSNIGEKVRDFVNEAIGPVELRWKVREGAKERVIKDISSLEAVLEETEEKLLERIIKDGRLSRWLRTIGEYEFAGSIEGLSDIPSTIIKEELGRALETYKYKTYGNSILDYQRESFGPHVKLSRIGTGALGGKARGLAFVTKLISRYITDDMLPGLNVTVPRTIILSTEVFDKFLKQNPQDLEYLVGLSDERIGAKFIESSLPATILGDLRSFVRQTRKPLIVRSSGVLEDSLSQPFAGVYASMLLPNESWDTDFRFQDVCNAIKYVYSSTFFEGARNYLKSTPKNLNDEKMAVILQEVVGKKHGKHFYPTISGVARSYNHYPTGCCKPESGVVHLSLGLGKNIVEGGRSLCFCPKHPRAPMPGSLEDRVKRSQNAFYALNLQSLYKMLDMDEETTLVKLDLEDAEKHGVLKCIASTYSDGRLYPGTAYDGARVVDFSPILQHHTIPLAKSLRLILEMTETALGYPVEIEFAVEFEEGDCNSATLYILQVRGMVTKDMYAQVSLGDLDEESILLYSDNSLGNGVIEDIRNVVFVKPRDFKIDMSLKAAAEIKKINRDILKKGEGYLLIGPGRWGSTDQWMGIPVRWSDIIGAEAIVETALEGRHIEPSQGSHFFHDLVSSNKGYLIVGKEGREVDHDWLNSQEVVYEGDHVKHVRVEVPLEVRLDGKKARGVVIKRER